MKADPRARLQELHQQIMNIPPVVDNDVNNAVFQAYRRGHRDARHAAAELAAACLAAEGEEEPPKYQPSLADVYAEGITMGQELTAKHLASAMRKVLPPALLDDVIAHLDPLTPFLAFLRDPPVASPASPEGED